MMTTVQAGPASARAAPAWHALPIVDAERELHVDARVGLTTEEAERRRADVGPNALTAAEPEPRLHAFTRQYGGPVQIVLLAAGIASFALGELATGVTVLLVTLVNAVLGLVREGAPNAAVAVLRSSLLCEARVRRDGAPQAIPAGQLVPGDVVLIAAGDVVPADGRLLESATLEVDESALTGERLPVAKGVDLVDDATAPLGDRTDMVYAASRVTRGTSEFVVTAIGMATEVGRIAALLRARDATATPLSAALTRLSSKVIAIAGAALLVSAVLNLAHGHAFETAFTAAVALAIAAVPAGLPAVIAATLAHGSRALARSGVIVQRLRAIELLGATSAIVVEKAGTLTLGEPTAVELAAAERRFLVSGSGYSAAGAILRVGGEPQVPLEPFLIALALASDAVLADGELTGDPTEAALVVLAEKGGLSVAATRAAHPRIAALPFDAAHKLTATFHRATDDAGADVVRCFVAGAPEELLARSAKILGAELRPLRLFGDVRDRYLAQTAELERQGLRVLATARRDLSSADFDPHDDLLPHVDGLTLLSLVGIADPPRTAARSAIAAAQAAGIGVRVITCDHATTVEPVARRLGIEGRTVTGAGLAAMSLAEAREEIDGIGVVTRVMPEHAVRLVELLRANGHVVAMCGSGVNDAPALQAADIGITMGADAVAREAAGVIVGDRDVSTIVRAAEYGRGLYADLVAGVRFQVGALAGMIAAFLGASVLDVAAGMPFLALQVVYIAFAVEVALAVGLSCRTPAGGPMRQAPQAVDEPLLGRREASSIVAVGLVQALVTLGVVALAEHSWETETARTMGLVTFSLMLVLWSLAARDATRSVFRVQAIADRAAVVAAGVAVAATVLGAQAGLLERILQTRSLGFGQWLLCAGAALSILVATALRVAARRGG